MHRPCRNLSWILLMASLGCSGSDSPADVDAATGVDGASVDAAQERKRVFVTSSPFAGLLDGADGADAKCQVVAESVSLRGTWKAWISTASEDAIDRIADASPWYLADQMTLAFATKGQLAASPSVPINKDEDGTPQSRFVWTGTSRGGAAAADSCGGWTTAASTSEAVVGDPTDAEAWTATAPTVLTVNCDEQGLLYCFEQ